MTTLTPLLATNPGYMPRPYGVQQPFVDGASVDGFVRYRGDDWDGANILLFQYGTLVPGAVTTNPDGSTVTASATITPVDIDGYQPVGTLLVRAPRVMNGPRPSWPSDHPAFTIEASTARIVDAPNGLFGFCPRADITSQFEPLVLGSTFEDATLLIAAKLIDSLGNLGTVDVVPILVRQA